VPSVRSGRVVDSEALLAWADEHWLDRGLPWREPGCPPELQVLVEGALPRTRAENVASVFWDLFEGVRTASGWLSLPSAERVNRCRRLGLGTQKDRDITTLAMEVSVSGSAPAGLLYRAGVSYTAAMAALRYGYLAAPSDVNLRRIAGRYEPSLGGHGMSALAALGATPDVTVRNRGLPEEPPPCYRAVCGLLDIGAVLCRPGSMDCVPCPLRPECLAGGAA